MKRMGETNIASNGMKITIIRYARNDDIDIQFEDGTIVKHKSYRHFKSGSIAYPIKTIDTNPICDKNDIQKHIYRLVGRKMLRYNCKKNKESKQHL